MESIIQQAPNSDSTPDIALQATVKNGANWFYWIAALSLINSLVIAFEGNLQFPVGLAITQLLAGIGVGLTAEGDSSAFLILTIVISLIISTIFAGLGYYAGKGFGSAFIAGIIFYFLDAIIYLVFGDFFGVGFHLFALFFIMRGFLASRTLKQAQIIL